MFDAIANGPWSLLNVPGWGGSSATHWQTCWEREFPNIFRVVQQDWENPDRQVWLAQLTEVLAGVPRPVVLVGHSLGVATIVHAAAAGLLPGVVGAFLVAMPEVERAGFPSQITGYSPLPRLRLPFPSVMIASQDDPYITSDELSGWAQRFGSRFIDVGFRHHIGDAAGLGEWMEGKLLLEEFLEGLPRVSQPV